MKNWNKPEIEEINVTLTMNGAEPSKLEATYPPDQTSYPASN